LNLPLLERRDAVDQFQDKYRILFGQEHGASLLDNLGDNPPRAEKIDGAEPSDYMKPGWQEAEGPVFPP
jgi:hypothetical protein